VVTPGGTATVNNNFTFHVDGVLSGLTVAIYADGGTTPIGTVVATGTSADVTTTVAVTDGPHTFTAKQIYSYDATTVGNRDIPAGTLPSDASSETVIFSVDTPPTAAANLSGLTINKLDATSSSNATFTVIYTNPGDTIDRTTIDGSDVLVTFPDGSSHSVTLVSVNPTTNAETLTAVYKIDASGREVGNVLNG